MFKSVKWGNSIQVVSFLLFSQLLFAQDNNLEVDLFRADAINVFMDADDFIKREITFVNYVRDRKDAHLNVIRTVQPTGAGGTEYTFFFEGLKEFRGINDTLTLITQPSETTETVRRQIVKTLKIGLVRYISKTPLIQFLSISYSEPETFSEPQDLWNNWVFGIGINGYLDGQKSYSSAFYSGNISANRITNASKTELGLHYNHSRDRFSYDDEEIIGKNESYGASFLYVISLGDRFSSGISSGFSSSTYSNIKARFRIMPAVEYNLFPYAQSTRRQLRFQYKVGYEFNNYIDTTIYDKTKEVLFSHNLSLAFSMVESWGSISFSGSYRNYLHDFSKRNLSFNGGLSLRVVKGFSLRLSGGASLIHDQLSLRKGEMSLDDLLLHQTELATQYRFYTSIGFSYTFGSIFSNVVNPRFGSVMMYY